jgi:hypothetical protein
MLPLRGVAAVPAVERAAGHQRGHATYSPAPADSPEPREDGRVGADSCWLGADRLLRHAGWAVPSGSSPDGPRSERSDQSVPPQLPRPLRLQAARTVHDHDVVLPVTLPTRG